MDDARRPKVAPLTEAEIADLRKRRAATKASLACEDKYLTPEEDAFIERLHHERVSSDEGAARIIEKFMEKRRAKAAATS